jgi:photosystem II stability/assembly factor-like uncharacterized protein
MKYVTIFFILVIIFLLSLPTYIHSQWVWQNPLPQGNRLYDVIFINHNTGWITGRYGSILKTTDGGDNWNLSYVNQDFYLYANYFINENTGFTGGSGLSYYYGCIYKTTNGGQSFSESLLQDSIGIFQIIFTDNFKGWACGTKGLNGAILHTTNTGNNWTFQQVNTSGWIMRMSFINSNTGFSVEYNGKIFKTTNGGNNWNLLYTDAFSGLESIFFINESTGWILGDAGVLRKTTNGGLNWISISDLRIDGYGFFIKFLNENTGWLSTANTYYKNGILKSTNGGLNWIDQNTQIETDEWFWNICIQDSNNISSVGDYGRIIKTTNLGNNWLLKSKGTISDIGKIFLKDINTGYVTANSYSDCLIYKTTNSGTNWNTLNYFSNKHYGNIRFINENTGICLGDNGSIIRTTNQGSNWQTIQTCVNTNFLELFFVNENTGWIADDTGGIIKTTDSGFNWVTQNTWINNSLYAICFSDINNGWATGASSNISNIYYPFILKTTNGGNNWLKIQIQNNIRSFLCMDFINQNSGWIAGDSGAIMITTNGGINWIRQNTNFLQGGLNPARISDLQFINGNTGYACASEPILIKTTNAGENWFLLYKGNFDWGFQNINFINENTGWITGIGGLIIKTTNGGGVFISQTNQNIPDNFILSQNYPNPFNPQTTIEFSLSKNSAISLIVYDITGREAMKLINNESFSIGNYKLSVNFSSYNLPSGIYFYRLIAEGKEIFSATKKMVYLK